MKSPLNLLPVRKPDREETLYSITDVATLRSVESGTFVADVYRELGITELKLYRWKRKLAGMGVAEVRRLKQLEDEKKCLKALVAVLTLNKHILQEVIAF